MTNAFISALEQIYGSSETPAAATDERMTVLWRNAAAEEDGCPLKEENIARFMNVFAENGSDDTDSRRLNVRRAKDGESTVFIAEYAEKYGAGGQLNDPDVKDYLTYLCARIRESAGMIAVSADEIDSVSAVFGSAGEEITSCLNTINKGLMLILREATPPEQFYYVTDPFCEDMPINAGDELEKAAEDAEASLDSEIKVSCHTEKDIFIRMNRSVFEAIAADMTEECCCGELFPEEVVFYCGKTENGKAEISVKSLNRSGRKNIPSKFGGRKNGRRIFNESFRKAVCGRYGSAFYSESGEDGYSCRFEIPLESSGVNIVMNSRGISARSDRFSTMALTLAERHIEKRYKFIDIDK